MKRFRVKKKTPRLGCGGVDGENLERMKGFEGNF